MADYNVVPFSGRDPYERRFQIVDAETGEVLDDAQGYGYKSPQKAHAAWGYKNRDKSKDAEKRRKTQVIRAWMKEHKSFMNGIEAYAFDIVKGSCGPDDKVDVALFKECLGGAGFTDLPFTAAELFKVWEKGSLIPGKKW